MKRVVSLLLALCMIFSCMTFVVSAEEGVTQQSNSATEKRYELPDLQGTLNITLPAGDIRPGQFLVQSSFAPMDVTGYEFLEIGLNVTNAVELSTLLCSAELTSSGRPDVEENSYNGMLPGLVEGWNTIRLPISSFTGNAADLTAINFVRIFSITGTFYKDVTIDVKYLAFVGGSADAPDTPSEGNVEKHTFRVFEASENQYLLRTTAGKTGDRRFSDAKLETVYHYTLSKRSGACSVTWTARVSGQLLL